VATMGVYIRSFLFLCFSLLVFSSVVLLFSLSAFICISVGMNGSVGELRYLAGSPGDRGGIGSCHTLIRVHTVSINNNIKRWLPHRLTNP
jgi:hypothetical protein